MNLHFVKNMYLFKRMYDRKKPSIFWIAPEMDTWAGLEQAGTLARKSIFVSLLDDKDSST